MSSGLIIIFQPFTLCFGERLYFSDNWSQIPRTDGRDQYSVTNDHSSPNQCFPSFDWEKKKPQMVTRVYLVLPETPTPPPPRIPPSSADKENALGSIVLNKGWTMWGDASHGAAPHVRAATQHWAANSLSPPTATQAQEIKQNSCYFFPPHTPVFLFKKKKNLLHSVPPSLKHDSTPTKQLCMIIFWYIPI